MTNRFIVEPGVNRYTKRRCFFVRDTNRGYEKIAGVNSPMRTRKEAEYLAWVLNEKHEKEDYQSSQRR
jgi:hypothetical protein